MKLQAYTIAIILIYISKGNAVSTAYIGCYRDGSDRAMIAPFGHTTHSRMTVDMCQRWCFYNTESNYLGTEWRSECFCGDHYDKYGRLADRDCHMPCHGNTSQICGGDWALSVYEVCPRGYYGTICTKRCHCKNDAFCLRSGGFCPGGVCATGWQGQNCSQDINECLNGNGGCSHTCHNTEGSYRCECRTGFELISDLHRCLDINECFNRNGGCSHTCTNTEGSYRCECRAGFELSSDLHMCHDINECLNGNGGCSHICNNTEGSYTCECRTGFELSSDRHRCQGKKKRRPRERSTTASVIPSSRGRHTHRGQSTINP